MAYITNRSSSSTYCPGEAITEKALRKCAMCSRLADYTEKLYRTSGVEWHKPVSPAVATGLPTLGQSQIRSETPTKEPTPSKLG